uniref:DNA polymerase delta subunit 2 n=1 Tax=Falco tinnunculus TaxID=100819 RepID=A0A8C4XRU2_FALTI
FARLLSRPTIKPLPCPSLLPQPGTHHVFGTGGPHSTGITGPPLHRGLHLCQGASLSVHRLLPALPSGRAQLQPPVCSHLCRAPHQDAAHPGGAGTTEVGEWHSAEEALRAAGRREVLCGGDALQGDAAAALHPAGDQRGGTIFAVYGSEQDDGKFLVEDHCFADLPQPLRWKGPSSDRFVLLVSGLGLGSGSGESLLSTQLLVDVVTGQLGAEGEQSCAAQISRVILAGNLLSQNTQSRDTINKAKYLTKKTQAASVEAVKMLDEILLQLCTSVPVDVMPGEFDPTNYTLPQQPLHHCMLPLASAYSTLRLVTNPYQADVDGVRFLGTSGQNVSDIFKYSSMDDYLEILEWTLRAGHISPTAPDTLGCYPFYKSDPFILTECPHVYFCGNAPHFQSKLLKGEDGQQVLLVTVPAFSTTQTACLVNLCNLSCQPISFSGFGAEDDDGDMEVGH